MVWIHGGAFVLGDGTPLLYGPDRYLDYDVIIVTINYRLGPLGFMSMGEYKLFTLISQVLGRSF